MDYPKVRRDDFAEELHGQVVPDPYRYMENPDDPETARFVSENNTLLGDYLDDTIVNYFTGRLEHIVNFNRFTVVSQKGDRFFFQKHAGLKSQPSLFFRQGLDGPDQLIMDFAELSDDGTLAPTSISFSDDGRYTSICLSQSGSDWHEMVILETDTGEELDRLTNIRFANPQWTEDGHSFYYTKFPPSEDHYGGTSEDGRIYKHQVGTPQSEDREIFVPESPKESPGAFLAEDKSHLAIFSFVSSGMGSKLSILDLSGNELTEVHDEYNGVNFIPIGSVDDQMFLRTNLDAPLQQIISLSMSSASLDNRNVIIPESEHLISGAQIAGGYLMVHYLIDAVSVLRRYTLEGQFVEEIELPQMGTLLGMSGKNSSPHFFFQYTSYPYLPTVYHLNLETGNREILFDNGADFNVDQYELKQVHYPSADGTQVSMFIIHRRGLVLDGSNPCLLWSYGGFNISLTPGASLRERYKVRLMIEEGGVYACPNIRGGGEYGKAWHDAGIKDRKQNVFDDFIAAAEYLINQGYTNSKLITSHGGSNGGLLVAATLLQRPDLFGCAVGEAGVMDMLRFHKFTFGRYWTGDYGDPDVAEDFEYILTYSPVHNVKEASYPPSLFYCADTDTRVVPMHTKKLVAELQYKQQGDAPILMRTETKAGHNFGKPVAKVIEETAIMFSFMWKSLGLSLPV